MPMATFATPLKSMDQRGFEKLLASIPVSDSVSRYSNLGEKLRGFGLKPTDAISYSYDRKSELEASTDVVGDIHYSIHVAETSELFRRQQCDFSGVLMYLKRRGKFYPLNRAAMWASTGNCVLPPR